MPVEIESLMEPHEEMAHHMLVIQPRGVGSKLCEELVRDGGRPHPHARVDVPIRRGGGRVGLLAEGTAERAHVPIRPAATLGLEEQSGGRDP